MLATARDLSFRPNPIARSLALGRTGSIGLVVPDVANRYFGPVIKAVRDRRDTYNDLLALGVIQSLTDRGKTVGADISVVGFDDIWLAPVTRPPLTTVHAPAPEAATTALRWLIEGIAVVPCPVWPALANLGECCRGSSRRDPKVRRGQ